jgi:LAO/AO transport system ATPase
MLEGLLDQFRRGDRQAFSRLLTLASNGEIPQHLLDQGLGSTKRSKVVAVTGSGGVGKSTLIGKLIPLIRKEKQTVGVLACDPRSPLTGGALLGDRFRMVSSTSLPSALEDDGVFIRSLAAAAGHGAVAANLAPMIRLFSVFGFDLVIIETVGAGQGDTAVRDLADVVILLLQPETGDELQWEKAGLLEVADIVVIHKGDLPSAEETETQVRDVLALSEGKSAKVLRVSSKSGQGVEPLWQAIKTFGERGQ